jgi:MOSC domain-containing protein YiiM
MARREPLSAAMLTLAELTSRHAQPGRVTWIGVRPARRAPMETCGAAEVRLDGLDGDRRTRPGKRAVTLVQAEHLPVIAALAGLEQLEPALLRRNVAVAGLNLAGLKGRRFRLGTATLRGTGPCAPCARMEAALGHGGYAAMRGHGGLCAEVLEPGRVALDDAVIPLDGA